MRDRHEAAVLIDQRGEAHVTIYDSIGGGAAVGAVVDELYRRALDDPDLKGYFDGIDMDRLNRGLIHKECSVKWPRWIARGPKPDFDRDTRACHA